MYQVLVVLLINGNFVSYGVQIVSVQTQTFNYGVLLEGSVHKIRAKVTRMFWNAELL